MTDVIDLLRRAPRPVARLAQLLAAARTPLAEAQVVDPSLGERQFLAATAIGTVRVWHVARVWGADLPPYDPACLEARVADRQRQGGPVSGLRLVLVLAAAAVFFVGTAWASVAFDQPGLRIVASVGLAGILVAVIAPYARRRQQRRAARGR